MHWRERHGKPSLLWVRIAEITCLLTPWAGWLAVLESPAVFAKVPRFPLPELICVAGAIAGQLMLVIDHVFDLLDAHRWLRAVLIEPFVELLVVGQRAFAECYWCFLGGARTAAKGPKVVRRWIPELAQIHIF